MKPSTTNPTTLADFASWELEAHADGVEIPRLAQFFATHPTVAAAWQQEQARLTQLQRALYRFDCPSSATLQDYHWQHIAPSERATIQDHVANCPHCQAELQELRAFLAPTPRHLAVQPAAETTSGWRTRLQDAVENLRIVVANLLTPPPQFAGAALRGATDEPAEDAMTPRSLLFEAEEMDISLLLQKDAAGTILLAGQLLTLTSPPPSAVKLIPQAPDQDTLVAQSDTTGNFVFHPLRPGLYQLQVALDDRLVVAPTLQIQ